MRTLELILALVLSFNVVVDVRYPNPVRKGLHTPIGMVVIFGLVLYLFTKSTILGVLGIVAGFTMVQRAGAFIPKYSAYNSSNVQYNNDPPMSNVVTLEETMVGNIVTVTNSPGQSTFQNSFSNVHNSGCATY